MASVKTFLSWLRPSPQSSAAVTTPWSGYCHRTTTALQITGMQARSIRTRGRTVVRREIVGMQPTPFDRPKVEDRPKRGRPSAQQLFDAREELSSLENNAEDEEDRLYKEQLRIVADQRSRKPGRIGAETATTDHIQNSLLSKSKRSDDFVTGRQVAPSNSQQRSNSRVDSSISSSQKSSKKSRHPDEPRMERVSKTLEAFPFVPGASTHELAVAHKFFIQPATFVKSASNLEMVPPDTLIPEVAFIGRSNIGKSSLINGLVNRNGLVKTSSKPGHTRLMNFFKIGGRLSLVDMPGYGFKSRDEWGEMILEYLQKRSSLKRVYILVDPSHGLKDSDKQIMGMLDGFGSSYQVVLTKADKLSKAKLKEAREAIEAELARNAICCFPQLLAVSSSQKQGLDELRAAILKAVQYV